MSFAKTVKEELVTIPVELEGQLAEFAAFLNLNTEFHIESKQKMLDFKTNSPTVAKRFLQLTKTLYQSETTLLTQQQNKLNKRQTIIVRVETKVDDIISEHGLLENEIESQVLLTQSFDAKRAFLRACFLAAGSMNHPKTAEYHLEIFSRNSEQIILIQSIMNAFELNAKITNRRTGYIVYIKDAEGISMFLQLIGAQNALFQFEDIRIKRDFNNSINRVMNCEIANEKKAIVAANAQLDDIHLVTKYYPKDQLNTKLNQIIEIRTEHPDMSLSELSELYEERFKEPLSKSGLNHRLKKLRELADKIRESGYQQ
ncbi:MAG: DNA-binding protein WhiA [Acholeplasmataceae bacterium]